MLDPAVWYCSSGPRVTSQWSTLAIHSGYQNYIQPALLDRVCSVSWNLRLHVYSACSLTLWVPFPALVNDSFFQSLTFTGMKIDSILSVETLLPVLVSYLKKKYHKWILEISSIWSQVPGLKLLAGHGPFHGYRTWHWPYPCLSNLCICQPCLACTGITLVTHYSSLCVTSCHYSHVHRCLCVNADLSPWEYLSFWISTQPHRLFWNTLRALGREFFHC